MSHDEFEALMKKISRAVTLVYQAEVATHYNVSDTSAYYLKSALASLDKAEDYMDADND